MTENEQKVLDEHNAEELAKKVERELQAMREEKRKQDERSHQERKS